MFMERYKSNLRFIVIKRSRIVTKVKIRCLWKDGYKSNLKFIQLVINFKIFYKDEFLL